MLTHLQDPLTQSINQSQVPELVFGEYIPQPFKNIGLVCHREVRDTSPGVWKTSHGAVLQLDVRYLSIVVS